MSIIFKQHLFPCVITMYFDITYYCTNLSVTLKTEETNKNQLLARVLDLELYLDFILTLVIVQGI